MNKMHLAPTLGTYEAEDTVCSDFVTTKLECTEFANSVILKLHWDIETS